MILVEIIGKKRDEYDRLVIMEYPKLLVDRSYVTQGKAQFLFNRDIPIDSNLLDDFVKYHKCCYFSNYDEIIIKYKKKKNYNEKCSEHNGRGYHETTYVSWCGSVSSEIRQV